MSTTVEVERLNHRRVPCDFCEAQHAATVAITTITPQTTSYLYACRKHSAQVAAKAVYHEAKQ